MAASEEPMGERLQRLRQAKGLSQADLAARARVPVGTLRNWEQGRRVPRLDAAAAVARALGVSLDVLAWGPAAAVEPARRARRKHSKG